MNFRYTIFATAMWLLFVCSVSVAQVLLPNRADSKQVISLNGAWSFKYIPSANTAADSLFYTANFNTGNWANIKVPGNWETQGFAEPTYSKVKEGSGLYRRTFTVPATWKSGPIYLAFDGVENGYTFWINGKAAGTFASAFNRQVFDVSALVSPGQNTIAVKVITHPKAWEFDTNDDWALSGISRNVTLFSLPQQHVKDVLVTTTVKRQQGAIAVKAIIERSGLKAFSKNLTLTGVLTDAAGKPVKYFTLAANKEQTTPDNINYAANMVVENAKLWTAETPYLYTLKLMLKDGANTLQTYTEHVGIREIAWKEGVLKVNGEAIKLKGATHHDISPRNGRAITAQELKQDILMMRAANMNFIRTSHYPPNPRLLELCDSLGMYMMDEVPFGFGDDHLKDASYLPNLLERAKLTLWRDKNHPCVIIWSVGNENPVTDIGLKTGRYVKSLDPTRPYCFPQTPTTFEGMLKAMPDSLDLLDDHYPKVPDLKNYLLHLDRPMVASEYAHALGLDFGSMEEIYETMYANPKLAGGAVWEFVDQGLLRKSPKPPVKDEQTNYAWASRDSVYDTEGNGGMDGIVYANRVPQTDYWQVRKVYTPVKAHDDTLVYKPGKQTFKITLENRYDFTDLKDIKCKWEIFANTTAIGGGMLPVSAKPHSNVTIAINAELPGKPMADAYYLKLTFTDKNQNQVYEKTFPIKTGKDKLQQGYFAGNLSKTAITANEVGAANYRFAFVKETGNIQLKNKDGEVIIAAGAFARVGRKPSITQDATTSSKRAKTKKYSLWPQFVLDKPELSVKQFDAHRLSIDAKYKPETPADRWVAGNIAYSFSDSGYVQVNYNLKATGTEQATETGLSFLVPSSFTEFRWVGKGPYAAYPGKDRLSEFGLFHLNLDDLYFPGNRQGVKCAVFSDAKGAGFAIVCDDANISVERTKEGILVSHNAYVAGKFNKYEWPDDLFSFGDNKPVKGSFKIIPFTATATPKELSALFGDLKQIAKPFRPFYHSYDQ